MKQNNKIKLNAYISHRGNSTWILGNNTLKVPLDDTLFVSGYNLIIALAICFNVCVV